MACAFVSKFALLMREACSLHLSLLVQDKLKDNTLILGDSVVP